MKELKKNELFEEERQSIHSTIIENHESKLKYLVVAKLSVIIIAAVGQLFLLKKLLVKEEKKYQPL